MARKSLSSLVATVAPAPVVATAKAKDPKAILSDVTAQVSENLRAALAASGVAQGDMPTAAALRKETEALFVSDLADRLKSLGESLVKASKSLDSSGVSLKPKGTGGRSVVHIPTTDGNVYTAGTVSVTWDGPIGEAIAALFKG